MESSLYLREIKGAIITVIVLKITVIFLESAQVGYWPVRTMDSLSCCFRGKEIPDSLQNKNTPIKTFLLSFRN